MKTTEDGRATLRASASAAPHGGLRALEGDGGPIIKVRARWIAGVAYVDVCPGCCQAHAHCMPERGALYLPMRCGRAYYVVDARARGAGARAPMPRGGGRSA